MSLRNLHANANITDAQLLARSDGFLKNFVSAFRQAAANGAFKFGFVELKDPDLNRVHGIVTEIDTRRLFFACGEDEAPRYAMQSLYEARKSIRDQLKGVWADRSCERLVQEISGVLSDFCTKAERLGGEDMSPEGKEFLSLITDMRLQIWVLVAVLQRKLGGVIAPRNLPPEIQAKVASADV